MPTHDSSHPTDPAPQRPEEQRDSSRPGDERAPRRRGRSWRKLSIALAAILVVLVVLLVMLPKIISSEAVSAWALDYYNEGIAGSVQVDELSLGWFGGQRVEGFALLDPQGEPVVTAATVTAHHASLWALATSSLNLGEIVIDRPDVRIVQDSAGRTNLDKALERIRPVEPVEWDLEETSLRLLIRDGTASVTSPGQDPVTVRGLQLTLDVPAPEQAEWELVADVTYGDGDQGRIDSQGTIAGLLDAGGDLQAENINLETRTSIEALPVALVDALAGQRGRLVALVGPRLDAQVQATGEGGSFQGSADVEAANMVVDAQWQLTAGQMTADGSRAALTLTPDAWPTLAGPNQQLAGPATLELEINRLRAPAGPQVDLAAAVVDVAIRMDDLVVDAGPGIGQVALRQTQGRIVSPEGSATLEAELTATGTAKEGSGQIALRATLEPAGEAGARGEQVLQSTLRISAFPVAVADELAQQRGRLVALLGPQLEASLNATAQIQREQEDEDADASVLQGQVQFEARSERLHAVVRAALQDDTVTAGSAEGGEGGSFAALEVTPDAAARLMAPAPDDGATQPAQAPPPEPILAAVAPLRLDLTHLRYPLSGKLEDAELGLRLTAGDIVLASEGSASPVIRDLALVLEPVGLDEEIEPTVTAKLLSGEASTAAPGTLEGTLSIDLDETMPLEEARLTITGFPTAMIEPWAGDRAVLLGPVLSRVVVTVQDEDDGALALDVEIEGDQLVATAQAQREASGTVTVGESTVRLALTPERFAQLQARRAPSSTPSARVPGAAPAGVQEPSPAEHLTLLEPAEVRLTIAGARLAMREVDGAATLDPAASSLDVALEIEPLQFAMAGTRQRATFEDITGSAKSANLAKGVALALQSEVQLTGEDEASRSGHLKVNADAASLFGDDGTLALEQARIDAVVDVQEVPVAPLDVLTNQQGRLVGLLGDHLTMQGRMTQVPEGPSPIALTIDSENTRASLKGTLGENFVLTEDAGSQTELTPELSQTLLSQVNPLLVNAVAGDQPVALTIEQEGFVVPIENFDIAAARADMQLAIGTVTLTNGGALAQLLSLLKRPESEQITASFTPTAIRLADGIVSYRDMTMTLTDDIVMRFEGEVNLVEQLVNLRTVLPAETLTGIFNELENVLVEGQEIIIPITGPIASPTIDAAALTKALAKSAAEGAIRQVITKEAEEALGEDAGKILGEEGETVNKVLDILGGLGKKRDGGGQEGEQQE